MTWAGRLIAALLVCCVWPAFAQDEAPKQPPAEEVQEQVPTPLVIRELLVIHADRYDDTANNVKLQRTALPAAIDSKQGRGKSTDDNDQYEYGPMPLGIITLQGEIKEPMTVQIKMPASSSSIQANWPSDAIAGAQHLSWLTVRQADDEQRAKSFGEQGAWLAELREAEDRLWIQSRDPLRKERFLLYDAAFRFKSAIDVTATDDQFGLKTNAPEQAAPPLSLLIRKQDTGWSTDGLSAPWISRNPRIGQPDGDTKTSTSLDQALQPIQALLEQRGYNAQEIGLALGMIGSAGVETSEMALVYILPVGVIDEYIAFDTKPMPDELIRTTIVVVNNVDPELGSRINDLIDDLSSDDWIKRDRAQRELINRKQAAIPKVR
ncbi:MAG: hypothetical protein AAF085_09860, partial [Planctomycetota bacterium]